MPGFVPEEAEENGMERTHVQHPCLLDADERADTLFHLVRRFVGERESHDFPRTVAVLHEVGYLVGQHPRLAGTGSRDDECVAGNVFYRSTLLDV